ncbi:uncharacterized protein BX664DRAFT_389169 [Halteromyces radiatus]|uniref:uncharacterized protein n=1 Tax=Halteromyces radiatus TaxID=101107 RepID=UPI00221E7EC5|nr:uncharacterized protein BX664DRAFT_389169 [Halteromyces radiatus]KAI8078787.1 hypothetical protein BX664DRAFT_389169 [Halteromyces radiatus]
MAHFFESSSELGHGKDDTYSKQQKNKGENLEDSFQTIAVQVLTRMHLTVLCTNWEKWKVALHHMLSSWKDNKGDWTVQHQGFKLILVWLGVTVKDVSHGSFKVALAMRITTNKRISLILACCSRFLMFIFMSHFTNKDLFFWIFMFGIGRFSLGFCVKSCLSYSKKEYETRNFSFSKLGPQIDIDIPLRTPTTHRGRDKSCSLSKEKSSISFSGDSASVISYGSSSEETTSVIYHDLFSSSSEESMAHKAHNSEPNPAFDLMLVDMIATVKSKRLVCVKKSMHHAEFTDGYACVSYRWGECDEQIALTPDYNAHVTSFAISDLILLCGQLLLWHGDRDDEIHDDVDSGNNSNNAAVADDDDGFSESVVKYLWVDAISVDQLDHNKKKTIHRMSEIFARAEVIVAVPDLHISYLLQSMNNYECMDAVSKYVKRMYVHLSMQCGMKKTDDDIQEQKESQDDKEKMDNDVQERKESQDGSEKGSRFRRLISNMIRKYKLNSRRGYQEGNKNKVTTEKGHLQIKSDNENSGVTKMGDAAVGNDENDDFIENCEMCPCLVGLTETEKDNFARGLRYLLHVVMDWANRTWVISECSIGRRTKMKLWFLSFCYENIHHQSRPKTLLDFFNERRPTIFDQPLKERSFLDMMLNSRATRNEDRFYAILPLYKEFKHYADNHEISTWGITDMLSVRLQLLRIVKFQEKLALLLLCTKSTFVSDIILPSFASCLSSSDAVLLRWATELSYKPSLLEGIELHKDEDANRDYLRITVPWSRTFTDPILPHDMELSEYARRELGLDLSELEAVFMPITVHDEKTNHTMGVKLLGDRQKNIWIMLNRMTDLVDVPSSSSSSSGNGSAGEHHGLRKFRSVDTLWSNKHEDNQVFHLY